VTADQLRAALDRLGWTQTKAAKELGVANKQRVSEWARGLRPVPLYIEKHLRTIERCRPSRRSSTP
jgi:transcriptional regulator with XRE-family HTH domain